MDHQDRDHHRDHRRDLWLEPIKHVVQRRLSREQGFKQRNPQCDICEYTLDIGFKNFDLSRLLDALYVRAQMQEFGAQVDANSGYAGSVAILYNVINAKYVNDVSSINITTRTPMQVFMILSKG